MALRIVPPAPAESGDRVRVRWRLLGVALPLSWLLFAVVTARWDPVVGQGPLYGFPLPFAWPGRIDPLALIIDLLVYLAAALAITLLVARVARRAGGRAGRIARIAVTVAGAGMLVRGVAAFADGEVRTEHAPLVAAEKRVWWGAHADR